jgi:hypothetical protein
MFLPQASSIVATAVASFSGGAPTLSSNNSSSQNRSSVGLKQRSLDSQKALISNCLQKREVMFSPEVARPNDRILAENKPFDNMTWYSSLFQLSSNNAKLIMFISFNTIVLWQILVRIQQASGEVPATHDRTAHGSVMKMVEKVIGIASKTHDWQNCCAGTGRCPYRIALNYHEFIICPILCIEKINLLGVKSQMMLGKHCACEVRF